jgi:DNA-binding GntR family transcriptional regulator
MRMNLKDLAIRSLQNQRSTPDLIAEALREAILRGIFKEGESLRQDEIATEFGVSRIPVREALKQLEAEGLVSLQRNRGATVAILSPTEAQEIFEIRSSLETKALELAIPNLKTEDLEKATEILIATDRATEVVSWGQLNWEFHTILYAPCNRPRLLGMLKTLHINIDRYVRLQMSEMNYLQQSQKEHDRILDACMRRDIPDAIEQLKKHIDIAGQELANYLRQRK